MRRRHATHFDMAQNQMTLVDGLAVTVTGRLLRTARLHDEHYVPAPDPEVFLKRMRAAGVRADLFTFVQELHDRTPRYTYRCDPEDLAVLPLTTFEHWMNKQIRFKSRNKFRKALKSGVETRVVEFSDDLLHGIKDIYNETPIRQGKRNWHYGKDLETLRQEHATFLDRSEFIGSYFAGELIGFAKVTHSEHYSIIMNIVAKVAHRDKAPANGLIAKIIELVTARKVGLLNYGVWGRRGLNDFKVSSAFERYAVPRYCVPLSLRGRVALKLGLHLGLKERLPEEWIVKAAELRARWNEWRHRKHATGADLPREAAGAGPGATEREA